MKRDIPLRGVSRRDFIRGVFATSAAMGLGPFHALSALEDLGGSALADEAGLRAMRAVNLIAGTGALAWFTLVWPAPYAMQNFRPQFAYDNPSRSTSIDGLSRQLSVRTLDGQTLWQRYGKKKLVSAILCSRPIAHSVAEDVPLVLPRMGVGMCAAQAALQRSLRSLVPSVGVTFSGTKMPYGNAKDAPTAAHVTSAAELAALFESSASHLADRLGTPRNKQLYEQYYRAVLRLHAMTGRARYRPAFSDAAQGVSLVGEALRQRLLPRPGQPEAWCQPESSKLRPLAELMIVTANALKLGLTAQVNIPVLNDDPHPAFADGTGVAAGRIADGFVRLLQSFMDELDTVPEPMSPSTRLSDNVILTISGDTPKDPFIAENWPDGTPGGTNWIYVMSQGAIQPGWIGSIRPGARSLFNPSTGREDMMGASTPAADCTEAALAAVLYATSYGNRQRVSEFSSIAYSGIIT